MTGVTAKTDVGNGGHDGPMTFARSLPICVCAFSLAIVTAAGNVAVPLSNPSR